MAGEASTTRHAFLEPDAKRGMSAIRVMLYHSSVFLAGSSVLPSACLAVAQIVRVYDEPIRRQLSGVAVVWRPAPVLALPSRMPPDQAHDRLA